MSQLYAECLLHAANASIQAEAEAEAYMDKNRNKSYCGGQGIGVVI